MVLAGHLYFFLQLRDTTRILLWILCRRNGSHFVQNVTRFLFEVKINFKSMAKHISIVRRFVWKIFLLKNSVKTHKFMNLCDFTEFFFLIRKFCYVITCTMFIHYVMYVVLSVFQEETINLTLDVVIFFLLLFWNYNYVYYIKLNHL